MFINLELYPTHIGPFDMCDSKLDNQNQTVASAKFEFWDEISRRRAWEVRKGVGVGWGGKKGRRKGRGEREREACD